MLESLVLLIVWVILLALITGIFVYMFKTHKMNRAADEKSTKWRTEFIESGKKFKEEQYALPRIDNKVSEVVPCRKCRSNSWRLLRLPEPCENLYRDEKPDQV